MRFIVGSEPWELAIVALFSHLLADFVGEVVRVGMESFLVPLIRCVAEHKALITCAEVLFVLLGPHTVSDFFTLGLDIDDDVALAAVEADIVVGVADSFGDFTSDLLEVDLLFSNASLSEKHDHVALSGSLHSDFSVRIDLNASIENTVRYLIAHLIRVAFTH